ncbi:PREDICTED: uncharacterized protein LOC101291734 [Fragaria vesca subsp. vesca]|uniref:uncharacterized protein LOC101291734 n=1 Tax=Fragaria vesca subsp. vesca TaxID=101020 RepID=UPI0002C2EE36|nr:PREDICTED: uncharacterized protein LOC101291734 [Fragaria vesca subsp. vesca]XP_011465479.1 PREDICTED: uncharacterized protein LOC101291734 [Fragaria vesca subsp. vesca]
MSMTLNFLGGAPFQLLYDGVKLAMNNTSKFKTHLRSLKFTLDCLQPQIIEQIRLQNLQLNIPVQEIQELQRKIDEGIVLVGRLSSINTSNIRVWGSCCNCLMVSYADQLDELDESLRRLLEILRLQSLAQVNQIGILARTARDRQDELGRRQLEILSNQRHIMDTLMKQQQIIERIEKNSVAASTGKGAPPVQVLRLGAVFQALFDAVVQVKGKNSKFKRLLEDFKFTLDCLKPLVQEIVECNKVLHFPKEEILEDFIVYLEKGVELVYKCSKSSLWNRFKRYEYINSLFELDESLQRLFNILRLQIETDVKEALVSVSKLEKEIEEIEGSFVLQHHQYESAAAEPQLPKVEVDVMNMQVTRDVMESMDSTGNVEVGDESHMRTEGSSLASHQIDVAVEEEEEHEEEREPLSPTILAGITELFDSALARSNMEVGDEQTVGQGEEDKEIWQLTCKEADKETTTPTVPLLAAHKRQASVETVVKNYEEHYAAMHIQVAFRRYLDRKSLRRPTVPLLAAHKRRASVETVVKNYEEHYAATCIQVAFRRYLDRKSLRRPTVPFLAAHKRRASVETVVKNYEEHYAATRIQVAFRRYLDRKSLRRLVVLQNAIQTKSQYTALFSSYEAACKLDSGLHSFDLSLQQRTSRVFNSLSTRAKVRSLSLNSLKEVSDWLLETNQEVVKVILECKKDIWNNQEIFSLVEEYFENSFHTLEFCTALETCLKRVVNNQLIIQAAVSRFEEEVEAGLEGKGCVKILQELRAFKAAGDPFREEFLSLFRAVLNGHASMLQILQVRKKRLDKKLKSVKAWRKVSNVLIVATFVSVLIFSVVAAAITAPPLVTSLARALAVSVGSSEKWCKILWSYYHTLNAQRIEINSMQLGTMDCMFTMTDLNNIRVLVEKCESEIEALLQTADFGITEENAVKIVMIEINKKLEMFMETVKSLSQNADECGRNIRRARTVILQRIISHPIK